MSSPDRWKALDHGLPDVPPIFLKYAFDHDEYRVQLTDLSRVWNETLCKDDIIRRASDQGSSVDPGEDDEQFRIFMSKINSALEGEGTTNISLHVKGDGQSLLLKLSAPLPRPLAPLEWTIDLTRLPEDAIAVHIVSPLVQRASDLQRQMQQLVSELNDKDRIISKITDRLETSGNSLTTVFPGVSNIKTSRNRSQREQLAKHVKGLGDFDVDAWNAAQASKADANWPSTPIVDSVLKCLPTVSIGSSGCQTDEWRRRLGRQTSIRRSTKPDDINSTVSPEPAIAPLDEFQRQATAERVKPSRAMSNNGDDPRNNDKAPAGDLEPLQDLPEQMDLDEDATTDDGNNLDAPAEASSAHKAPEFPSSSRPVPSAEPVAQKTSAKLGAIRGRGASPRPSQSQETLPAREKHAQRSRQKLGAIGGKVKPGAEGEQAVEPHPGSSTPAESEISTEGAVPIASTRRGVLPSTKPSSQKVLREPSTARATSRLSAQVEEMKNRETSQERADRNRGELQKEMEQKAKAPVKKKRKF